MSDVMRAEFEKAYTELQLSIGLASTVERLFVCEGGGEYTSSHTSIAWWAWRASRAAIEVNLPDLMTSAGQAWCVDAQRVADARVSGFNDALRKSNRAIKDAGIKVKP